MNMENNSFSQVLSVAERQLAVNKTIYPEGPDFLRTRADLLAAFENRVKEAGGEIFRPADAAAAQALLASQHAEAKVICSAAPEIPGSRDMHAVKNSGPAGVDVAVIRARLGVAENGMVWLTEEDLVVNAPGVLPPHLVILLSPQAIVGNMYDAYLRIHLEDTAYGCFVMGPSATADIEAVLVHGAQGARSLRVYLLA